MRCCERAAVHDLFNHAVQVDQLLSPSCKWSFCFVLSLALQARWLPDGPGKVFALGYCRPACLCLFQLRQRQDVCVCRHALHSPTLHTHTTANPASWAHTWLHGSHPQHATAGSAEMFHCTQVSKSIVVDSLEKKTVPENIATVPK